VIELGDKMAGLYHITTAGLKAEIVGDNVRLTVMTQPKKFNLSIPTKIFFALEPKEIVEMIDKSISGQNGEPISILRTRFDGHDKNPFSSQN
tara:strand:+ start:2621 stop:2896 length:276 start_codon:yes stop_codon:yes gene_type:complete